MKTLVASLCAALVALPALAAVGVTGAWTLDLDPNFGGMPQSVECALEQDGVKIGGDCAGVPVVGDVSDPKVTFQVKVGQNKEFTATFTGEYDDQILVIHGTWRLTDTTGAREGRFTMLRHE